MRPVMRPPIDVRLRRLFKRLWEVGQGDKVIVALVLGCLVSQANLTASMDRRIRDRPAAMARLKVR